jgi:hypothetical protein
MILIRIIRIILKLGLLENILLVQVYRGELL